MQDSYPVSACLSAPCLGLLVARALLDRPIDPVAVLSTFSVAVAWPAEVLWVELVPEDSPQAVSQPPVSITLAASSAGVALGRRDLAAMLIDATSARTDARPNIP